jgi:hypothetical protein
MKTLLCGSAAILAGGAAALASPTLQMDLNAFSTQAKNGGGANSAFGGLNHTGAINFSLGAGVINGLFIQPTQGAPFQNANFSGTWTAFTGSITLNNGQVTGGSLTVTISGGDSYTCGITPGSGFVSNFVGGGFKVEALTRNGLFNDAQFGNVNVSPWFNAQNPNGLPGSFLQFNFTPNAAGFASADMDLFVDVVVVPLPPASWAGLAALSAFAIVRRAARR